MNFLEQLYVSLIFMVIFLGLFSIIMVFYLSRYHMKVMDKIIHHHTFSDIDDTIVFKVMRIATYQVNIFVKRNREQLPLETQKKIIALDKKFRFPFLILIWDQILAILCILSILILENHFNVDLSNYIANP